MALGEEVGDEAPLPAEAFVTRLAVRGSSLPFAGARCLWSALGSAPGSRASATGVQPSFGSPPERPPIS